MHADVRALDQSGENDLRLLTLADICSELDLSLGTLKTIMGDAKQCFPPTVLVGKRRYVRRAALQTWLRSREIADAA